MNEDLQMSASELQATETVTPQPFAAKGPTGDATLAPGLASASRILDHEEAADDATSGLPPQVAQQFRQQLDQLKLVADVVGPRRSRLIISIIQSAAVEGVDGPGVKAKILELAMSESESLADRFVPVWRGARDVGRAVSGEDGEGRRMSFGQRVLGGLKGLFSILLDVHTLGLGGSAIATLSKVSRVKSAANKLETATRLSPLLGEAIKNPSDPTLFVAFLQVIAQPSFSQGLQSALEQKIMDTLDGNNPSADGPDAKKSLDNSQLDPVDKGGPS